MVTTTPDPVPNPIQGSLQPSTAQAKPAIPLTSSSKPVAPAPAPTPATPPPSSFPPPKPAKVSQSPFRFIVPLVIFLLILGMGFLVVTKLLPLFSGSRSSAPPAINLTYWGLWEPSQVLQGLITDFETANPGIKITYQQQSHKDYRERLQTAINSNTGPDLFRFHHTWVPMLTKELATVPSDIISTGDFEQTFYPVASQWLRSSKGLVGIPLMYDGLGLYYNKAILSAAGKTPPKTWDELRRTAKQVTVKQENTILRGGVALGTTTNVDHWPDIVGLMLLQNSADPQKPNNRLGQDALTFYTLFTTADKVWDTSMPESTTAFATEKVVMMIAPSWRAHDVANINPELDFAVAPAPILPDTDEISWASFWAEGVSAKSGRDKQTAAWKFIAYLAEKDNLRRFYQSASTSPGRLFGEPFSRVDLADQLASDPYVGAFITQAPYAKSWFLSFRTWDNGLNDKIIKYYEDALNLILDGEDATDILTPTEQGIAQVFSQYGLSQ